MNRTHWTMAAVLAVLAMAAVTAARAQDKPAAGMTNPFFAMDTGTKDANHKTADEQVAMVKELGYAGIGPIYHDAEGVKAMQAACDKYGVKDFAEYVGMSIDGGKAAIPPKVKEAIEAIKGHDTMLWLTLSSKKYKPSAVEGDAEAVEALTELADLAQQAGVKIALYPHTNNWVEKVGDAVRLAEKVGKKNLGATFNLCHYLKADNSDLQTALKAAMPHLFVVTINGADVGGKDWKTLIQTLDQGTYDVGGVLKMLKDLGYTGPIGLQLFGVKGSAYDNLKRSIQAWRKLAAQAK